MQIKYVAGSALLMGSLGALMFTSLQSSTLASVPVTQLRERDAGEKSLVGQRLRVVGFVGDKPLERIPLRTEHGLIQVASFEVVEDGHSVTVSYADALPDTFRAGGPVQVDGVYEAPGVMRADHVLTKCPSKYEEGAKGGATDGQKVTDARTGSPDYERTADRDAAEVMPSRAQTSTVPGTALSRSVQPESSSNS